MGCGGSKGPQDGTQPEASEAAEASIQEVLGKHSPAIPSKAAAGAVAKVVGKTATEAPLTSPITGTSCVFYTVTVQEWRKENDGPKKSRGREFTEKYRDLFTKTEACNFELTDNNGGSCSVNARPGSVTGLGFTFEEESESGGKDPSDALKKLMEANNEKLTSMMGSARKLKVVERVISVGEVAGAVGMVQPGAGEGKVQLEPARDLVKPGASSIVVRDEASLAGMLSG